LISFVSAGFWSNFFAKITGNPVSSSNNTCSDGDLGIDIYHTTEVSNTTITYQDKCVNDSSLIEYYCDESNVKSSYHSCPVGNSCLFGRCVSNQICRDIDRGLNMFVKATCRDSSGKQFSDSCSDIIYLKDYACTSETAEGKCVEYSIFCSNGCVDGVCLETIKVVPNEETGPINLPDISFYGCSGCVEDKKCYPFGYRKGGEYCSDNFYFIAQLKEKSKCDNNFECTSNSCVSGQCVSEGLLKKILNWFKKIF